MGDSFLSIAKQSEFEYKDKGSRFIALAFPCVTAAQFKHELERIKAQYPSATHYCYAYRFGTNGAESRANDDGEPSGTAGFPILNQILSAELSDIAIVVVRYFGGTKLGASGLIKAYKKSAAEALKNAIKIEKHVVIAATLEFSYEQTKPLEILMRKLNVQILRQDFQERCSFDLEIRKSSFDEFQTALSTFETAILRLHE